MTQSSTAYSAAKGRRFGFTLAIAFGAIALFAAWRERDTPLLIFGSLAAAMALGGIAAPASLEPVERAWMAFAHLLSKITTPIFMGIVYFVLLAPVGLIRRAMGKNALVRPLADDGYWVRRPPTESDARRRRMERQF
jgi:Saxitoxin biosynthesis operon protein SxtJ